MTDEHENSASLGDMAARLAAELQEEHLQRLESDGKVVEHGDYDDVMTREKRRGPFSKIRFRWRESDQLILTQIRAAANFVFQELFLDAIEIIDEFYSSLRVARVNSHGVVVKDEGGRVVWETDDRGNYIEDWSLLTGQDIDRAVADIAKLKLHLSVRVNELLMDALYAKRVYTDTRDDVWGEMIEGTVDDKTAKANRKAREDNYHAFFRFWIWSQGDVFLKELKDFQRVLEKARDRRIWNEK